MNIKSYKYTTLFLRITLAVYFQAFIVLGTAQKVEIRQLKIGKSNENVFASDYFDHNIYFCSDRKIKSKKESINENNLNFLDIYCINYDPQKNTSGDYIRLDENINSSLNEGPIDFNDNTKFGYFSSNINDTTTNELYLGLFQTQNEGSYNFKKRVNIFDGPNHYNIAHPTINEDGNMLVFSSDRPDVQGQTDLFYSINNDGKWSAPEIIPGLNTIAIETFPHFYKNILYFASDRQGGKGGLDIYQCEVNNKIFSNIKALEGPYNSEFDDFLFIPINETSGIFSSNRNQFDRIFSYQIDIPQPVEIFEINDNFCFELSDDGNIDTTRFKHEWHLGDGSIKKGTTIKHCYSDTGVYEINCNLIDSKLNITEESFISTEISIQIDKPTIQYTFEKDVLKLNLDQKYSQIKYSNFYWIVNHKIYNSDVQGINITGKENLTIQVVIWEENKESSAFGILKKLTLKQ